MPYTLAPDPKGKYIVAKVTGDITRQLTAEFSTAVNAMGAELGIRGHLIDVTEARNVESITENYKTSHDDPLSSPEIDLGACLVALVDPDDHSHDFVEALYRSAGRDFTVFRDRDQAIAHLLAAVERLGPRPEDGRQKDS